MDALLVHTPDGSEFSINAGDVAMTPGLDNAAYLSLFGGNSADDGIGEENRAQWWGNDDAMQLRSRLQFLVRSLPATAANLRKAEDAAKQDLAWLLEERVVNTLTIMASLPAPGRLSIQITFNGDQRVNFLINWELST